MNILGICDNGDVLSVFRIVNIVITIIKIVVPIILMLSLMIDYAKAVADNNSDALAKISRTAVSKVVAAILVFYIPTFVTLIANISSFNKDNYLNCLTNATPEGITQAYENLAQKYLDIAKNELTDGSYLNAQTQIMKLKNEESKKRLAKELEKVKKALDEKKAKSKYGHQRVEKGWWFPIGGATTTIKNGKSFALGNPVSTRLTAYFAGNDKVHKGLGSGHGAIDIGVGRGNYVIATRSGTVVNPTEGQRIDYPEQAIKPNANGKYNCSGLYANYVVIDHGDGTISKYSHLYKNTITVKAGDHVEQGQIIGKVGSSGCSTGPHLHFEVHVNGQRVDPLNYVDGSNPRS